VTRLRELAGDLLPKVSKKENVECHIILACSLPVLFVVTKCKKTGFLDLEV
jgi:hypothetical protein